MRMFSTHFFGSVVAFCCFFEPLPGYAQPAVASPPCTFTDSPTVNEPKGSFPISGVNITYIPSSYFSFDDKGNGYVDISEINTIDLEDLQGKFLSVVLANTGAMPSSCSYHIKSWSAALSPNAPNAIGVTKAFMSLWKCTSFSLPCPTLQKPGRMCVNSQKTALGDGSVTSVLRLQSSIDPKADGGRVAVSVNTLSNSASVSNTLVTSIYKVTATVLNLLQLHLAPTLEGEIARNVSSVNMSVTPGIAEAGSNELFSPILASTQFLDIGAGKLGIRTIARFTLKERTACFLRSQL